jgi:hypothetical protein
MGDDEVSTHAADDEAVLMSFESKIPEGPLEHLSECREAGIPPSSERGPSGPAPKAPRAGDTR